MDVADNGQNVLSADMMSGESTIGELARTLSASVASRADRFKASKLELDRLSDHSFRERSERGVRERVARC